jgi:hypothetical protein
MKNMRQWQNIRGFSHQNRVCLPFGVNLLELARWIDAAGSGDEQRRFELFAGSSVKYCWNGKDVISLYSDIQCKCLEYSLDDSYVVDMDTNSALFFDQFGRFSMFSANEDIIRLIYPFSREVMWENFALSQESDDEFSLIQIFTEIHSKQ